MDAVVHCEYMSSDQSRARPFLQPVWRPEMLVLHNQVAKQRSRKNQHYSALLYCSLEAGKCQNVLEHHGNPSLGARNHHH